MQGSIVAAEPVEAPELVVLVGAARSGTTLLRLILDAHREIACPAEAGVPGLAQHLGEVWGLLETGERTADPELSDGAMKAIRSATAAPMSASCARDDKRIYCDKSLDSVHYLKFVYKLFPKARYVLLFRHVMDTVASGLEASPYGFQGYGYGPFVQSSPDNFVAALVTYWLAHVDKALQWDEAQPECCHRLRYEDLVTVPDETVTGICGFLGVKTDLSVLTRAFERSAATAGPGDYKVSYTSGVQARSIGRGKRVPISMIPPPLLDEVNKRLERLGYEALSRAWNAEPTARSANTQNGQIWADRLVALMDEVELTAANSGAGDVGPFAVVTQDHEALRWVLAPSTGDIHQGDGEVDSVVTGTAKDLVMMISQEENMGVLLRSGRIRRLTAREDVPHDEVVRAMRDVLDVLRTSGSQANGLKSAVQLS